MATTTDSTATAIQLPDYSALPYKVAEMTQADFGRKEIAVSEHEKPGLMAVREKYGRYQPL